MGKIIIAFLFGCMIASLGFFRKFEDFQEGSTYFVDAIFRHFDPVPDQSLEELEQRKSELLAEFKKSA